MSSKKKRNRAKVIDAKWDATLNPGKEIQLINGGFAIVDEDNFEYFNQWKWFLIEDVGAARFEYYANGELNLILLADEVMGVQSYYVEFEDLEEELRPFAKIEDENVFDTRKYERACEFGVDRPMRSFANLKGSDLRWNRQIFRIVGHRRGKHIIAACPLPTGNHQVDIDKNEQLYDSWSYLALQEGFYCWHKGEAHRRSAEQSDSCEADGGVAEDLQNIDGLVVLSCPDEIADRSKGFKIAISNGIPLFDASSDPIRIWNSGKGRWDDFCEKTQMYPAMHQYLTGYWSTGKDSQERLAESTEEKAF